jgi:hypothetical protein
MGLAKSWGPSTWNLLHCLSLSWNPDKIDMYIKLIKLIRDTIPCHICKKHFIRTLNRPGNNIKKNCSDKDLMFKWTVRLHNNVNRMNSKRIFKPNQARNIYIKNGKVVVRNGQIIRFLIQFVRYNINQGGWRRYNAFKIMKILSHIYPSPGKQEILEKKLNEKHNKMSWLKIYINTLKKK